MIFFERNPEKEGVTRPKTFDKSCISCYNNMDYNFLKKGR